MNKSFKEFLNERRIETINPISPIGKGAKTFFVGKIDPNLELLEKAQELITNNYPLDALQPLKQIVQTNHQYAKMLQPLINMIEKEEKNRIGITPNTDTYLQAIKLAIQQIKYS